MIVHDRFRRLAAWAIDQPLSADQERELEMHRTGCDTCVSFEDGLRADALSTSRHRALLPGARIDRRIEAAIYGARSGQRLSPMALLLIMAIMLVAAASAVIVAGSLLNRDQVRLPDRPAVPDGWIATLASSRDLRLTLPPYLGVQDVDGTVFANESPGGNPSWLQVMAAGPTSAEQPRAGQSLESWLRSFLSQAPLVGVQTRAISLPAGQAVELRAFAEEGTPEVAQIVLYAVQTADGAAFLWLTGRPEDFVNHAADLQLIPQLLETGPALTALLPPEPPGYELRLTPVTGWHQMSAPLQTNEGPRWSTFISNLPLPADLCGVLDGIRTCSPRLADGTQGAAFILGVVEIRGGVPRAPVDSASFPPTVHRATIGGHAAIRTDELVPREGSVEFIWEVPSPGEPSGVFVVRMIVTADGYQELLSQVELMLEEAEFVTAGE
jgi:hypothetical protein